MIDPLSRLLEYPAVGKAIIRDTQLREPDKDDVIIRTLFSGISRGTENLVFNGQVPKSEHERMRCPHMQGDFHFPVAYGYNCVGEIVQKGSAVAELEIGQAVFVLHPHQTLFRVKAAMCNPLPRGLSPHRAVLAANMETALNAVWDAELPATPNNMRCAVIGAGVVGLLTAHALETTTGLQPLLIDVDSAKREIVESLGFEMIMPEGIGDAQKGDGFDLVFHTSASAAGLQTAIDHAAFEAKIIEMSWYGDKTVPLHLGGAFHSQRLRIISSQVGSVAPSRRASHSYAQRMQDALDLLKEEKLDHLLEPAIEFEELPNHLTEIFGQSGGRLCQLVHYS